MGKYQPLTDRLAEIEGPEWRANFAELEKVLGFELPKSAREQLSWWSNQGAEGRPHKRAWLDGGWQAEDVDLEGGTVVFRKEEPSAGTAGPSVQATATAKPAAASPNAELLPAVKDPTPPAIQHAVRIYDRRKRAVKIGKFAIGGGVLAAVVATAAGAGAFMLGRFLQRR